MLKEFKYDQHIFVLFDIHGSTEFLSTQMLHFLLICFKTACGIVMQEGRL